jgi:hypothetical protein
VSPTTSLRAGNLHLATLGKEKRIPTQISLDLLLVILFWVEFLPYASRKNMLVAFIPSTINYLGEGGVVITAFQIYLLSRLLTWLLLRGTGERVIIIQACRFGVAGVCRVCQGARRLRAVLEEDAIVGSEGVIYDEIVEVVMLLDKLAKVSNIIRMQLT